MFYHWFRFYGFVYLIASLKWLVFTYDKKSWDTFTRVASTYNAIQCVYHVLIVLTSTIFSSQYYGLNNIFFIPSEQAIESLNSFSAYLLIDGVFQIAILTDITLNDFLMILHHVLGCWGIWTLANIKIGYFLAFYFALTEISTPALNWSWLTRSKNSFTVFYILFISSRILTLPLLWNYLNYNSVYVYYLSWYYQALAYGASGTISLLNCIWGVALTVKLVS